MLGKRIINTGADAGASCTTDTVQILDGVPFDSIATYELESDGSNSVDTGYIGKSAVFNGSSSKILAPSPFTNTEDVSVSLWVQDVVAPSSSYRLFFQGGGNDYFYISVESDGEVKVYPDNYLDPTYARYTTTLSTSNSGVTNGDWHHIVVVNKIDSSANGGGYKIYIDGVLNAEASFSSTLRRDAGSSDGIGIGSSGAGTGAFFEGKIDEVRIYNTALTAGNVATLYAETASSTISISGLQAHYKFEGDATDETGNYNGTASNITYNEYDGTATNLTYAAGQFGNAAVFSGNSYINTGIDPSSFTKATVSFWFKRNGVPTNSRHMIWGTGTSTDVFGIVETGSTIWIAHNTGTTSFPVSTFNSWNHIVISADSSTFTTYLNGVLIDSNKPHTFPSFTRSISYIGRSSYANVHQTNGSIDQVRIYDQKLSAANVAELYAETLATSQTNPLFSIPSGVAYYKMNDATDETGSYDASVQLGNFNIAGKFGNAVSFDGVLNSGMVTGQNWGRTNDFAISVWVKDLGVGTAGYQYKVLVQNYKDDYLPFGYDTTNKLFNFPVHDGTTLHKTLVTASNIDTSYWRHLVLTQKLTGTGAGAFLYLDGNLEDSYIGAITQRRAITSASYTSTTIAKNQTGQANLALEGRLDQVRLFDRFISSDEVTTLYNEVYCQPTIVPTDHFETVLYTGGGASAKSIDELDFQPDLVWIKSRTSTASHVIHDVQNQPHLLITNGTNALITNGSNLVTFTSNGFDLQGGASHTSVNGSNNFVAWNWKAGGTAAPNTNGTTTSYVSANQDAGFSIVKHGGSNTITVGHGLSQAPELIIQKRIDGSTNWIVHVASLGYTHRLQLNTTDGALSNGIFTNVNSSTFSFLWSSNSYEYINYAFHSVEGFSKIGYYVGTNAGGHSIVTGFRPKFLLTKRSSADGGGWNIFDSERGTDKRLYPHLSNAEGTDSPEIVTFNSNGFTLNTADSWNNGSYTYIYLAFAEEGYNPNGLTRNASDPFGDSSEVAFYKFEDDATDSTGSNDGTFTTPSYATGYIDKAAVFNGSSSSIISTSYNINLSSISLSYWFKDEINVGLQLYLNSQNHVAFGSIGANIGMYARIGNSFNHTASTTSKVQSGWNHLAFVLGSGNIKVYLNGNSTPIINTTKTYNIAATKLNISKLEDAGGPYFYSNTLDQVRIFDRALDSGEVTQLYNE